MARFFAFIFFIASLVRVYFDWQETTSIAEPFRFAEIGSVWASIHFGSLQVFQPAIERYIGTWMWESLIFPILLAPMAPVLFGIAIVFWLFRNKKR